jgi:glycosyltransferase involved in cell wall biosynthesis
LVRRPDLARHTVFTGDVRNVAEWLNGFDVFVLPSLSEGMSNTLLEAMAVGLPAIATAVGGNTEVIEDGHSGLLTKPRDAETICSYLMHLANYELRRGQLGRNARDRVTKEFSLDRMLKRYQGMYWQVMEPRKKGTAVLSRA